MNRGYVLIEALVASLLFSIAGAGLSRGLVQGVKAERTLRETAAIHDPVKVFWLKAQNDLRNTVLVRGQKFIGKNDEMTFAIYRKPSVYRVRYFTEGGNFKRGWEVLPEKFSAPKAVEKVLIKNVESVRFGYAHLEEEERLIFKPRWKEELSSDIPKAVRVEIKLKNGPVFSRVIYLPQGKWGRILPGEESHE